MDNIEKQTITHKDVRSGFSLGADPDGIGAYTQSANIQKTFLSNPNLDDDSDPMVAFIRVDGSIWGRCMYFPSRIKIGEQIEKSMGGSSLLVNEEGRKKSLGIDLMMLPMSGFDTKYLLYAGISKMAIPLYKKLRFELFEMPCRWQIRNSKPILQSIGLRGIGLSVLAFIANILLKSFNGIVKKIFKFSLRDYQVKKLEDVPDWITQMVINDKHKYAEYHDKKWFEWVLSNNFFGNEHDVQALYGIYRDDTPVGFVLIKEQQSSIEERHIDKITFGSVVEWGFKEDAQINEHIINKIALNLYSSNVDIAQVISSDIKVVDYFGKYAMFRHGSANIIFKDLTKKLDKDYKNPENWRLRPGYSDVPFY